MSWNPTFTKSPITPLNRYGKHLSAEAVNELINPKDRALEAVHGWLEDVGVHIGTLECSLTKD